MHQDVFFFRGLTPFSQFSQRPLFLKETTELSWTKKYRAYPQRGGTRPHEGGHTFKTAPGNLHQPRSFGGTCSAARMPGISIAPLTSQTWSTPGGPIPTSSSVVKKQTISPPRQIQMLSTPPCE